MLKRYRLSQETDYAQLMEKFGGEDYLKENFSLLYEAFQRGKEHNLKASVSDDGEVYGLRDCFQTVIEDGVRGQSGDSGDSSLQVESRYNYCNPVACVVVDNTLVDETGKVMGANSFVSTNEYKDQFINKIDGIIADKSYELSTSSTFTSFIVNDDGQPVVRSIDVASDQSKIYVHGGDAVVKSVVVIAPVNKYKGNIEQTYIVYGNRQDQYVSYRYKDAPNPDERNHKLYTGIFCPFKCEITLNDQYTFYAEKPLASVDFSVSLESADPDKYGGGGVYFNNSGGIKTTLSQNNQVLTVEIPDEWKVSLEVEDVNVRVGAFNFWAQLKVNYPIKIAGQIVPRMTPVIAATEVVINNASAYVDPVRIHWGCMAKDTLLQTPDKIVAVEQLKKGDRVLTITGDYERITNIIPGKSDYMVSIQPEGEQVVLKLTDGHGIMTNRGLIPAGDLRMDDEILMSDGDYRGLSYLAVDFYGDDVYDIETENNSLLVASGMIVAGKGTLKSQNMVRKNKKQPELPKEFLEELKRWCEERNRNR